MKPGRCVTCGKIFARRSKRQKSKLCCSPACNRKRLTVKWRDYQHAYTKVWRAANKEKIKRDRVAYKAKDPEAWRRQKRESVLRNPISTKLSNQRWTAIKKERRKTDPVYRDSEREYHKDWRIKNPDKLAAEVKRRLARLRERRKNDPIWRAAQNAKRNEQNRKKAATIDEATRAENARRRTLKHRHRMKTDPVYRAKRKEYSQQYNIKIQADPIRRAAKNARLRVLRVKWSSNPNPKGEKQWLQKSRAELAKVNRLLKEGIPLKVSASPRRESTPPNNSPP